MTLDVLVLAFKNILILESSKLKFIILLFVGSYYKNLMIIQLKWIVFS